MSRTRGSARAIAVVVPALLASGLGVVLPSPARAEECVTTTTWTGAAGNGTWSDATNWSGGSVPGPSDRAVLDTAAGTLAGLSGTVCGLLVSGGTSASPTTVVGDLRVTGRLDLAGTVAYLGTATGLVTTDLATAPSTDLTFVDGTTDLRVTGAAVLAGAALLHRSTDPSGAVGRLVTEGTLSLAGDGVRLQDVGLVLRGTVDLGGRTLALSGGVTPDLATSTLETGSTLRGGGVLRVGKGAAATVTGVLDLLDGSVLELDDESDGSAGRLDARDATLRGGAATDGTFRWCSGQLRGRLTVDRLTTEVGTLSGSGCGASGRRLLPLDETARGALTTLGPLSMQGGRILMAPRTEVLLGGATRFGAVAEFAYDGTGAPDATVVVLPTATVTVAPVTLPGLNLTIPSIGVLSVPLVNQGTVELNASSLTAAGGYLQEQAGGSTVAPVTAIFSPPPTSEEPDPPASTLSTVAGAEARDVVVTAGGLYGNGTVKARTTRIAPAGSAWVRPFVSETAPGRLRVEGDLLLGSGSDLQLVVGPQGATGPLHDAVEVVPLPGADGQPALAPGAVTLGGRVTSLSRTGYAPAYLTTASDVLVATALSGTFASSAYGASSAGLGWKPVYDGSTVDLQLVDVAPPALGVAGIAAFTPLATQRVTYAAVDNKTGVKTYDVRWRRSSPTAVGGWTYPASWQNRAASRVDHTGLAGGWTYCYAVRVRDRVGNVTDWSRPSCTTRLADDRALTAGGRWSRPSGAAGFSAGTLSRSTTAGSTLRAAGWHTRVAVTTLRCPTCGVVDVFSGSKRLVRLDLRASSSVLRTWTSGALTSRNAPVTLRVVTSGRPVVVDAFALQRT